jgi:hypothetical protein
LSNGLCLLFEVEFESSQFAVGMAFLTPFEAGDGGGMALEEMLHEREMRFEAPVRHDVCDADGGRGNVADVGEDLGGPSTSHAHSCFRQILAANSPPILEQSMETIQQKSANEVEELLKTLTTKVLGLRFVVTF